MPSSFNKAQHSALVTESPSLWHKRLAHANNDTLKSLFSSNSIHYNKESFQTCHACHLGKHQKLPFSKSITHTSEPFELIHSDVWTSPVPSLSGIRYYVLFLDDFSHFLWVYPIRNKSDVFSKFLHFSNYIKKQFGAQIKAFQCDNGGEYNNKRFQTHFDSNGIVFRFSCPYTSQQNGKSERMIRTINNAIISLLFQSHLSPAYWAEALHVAAHIINILPSSSIGNKTPHSVLLGREPTYDHLKVFGSLCFPNINNSTNHKLSPRSTPCLFLGYPLLHRGYRCLDLRTNRIIISRHVLFDETTFPAAQKLPRDTGSYSFLDHFDNPSPVFQKILIAPHSESTNAPAPVLPAPPEATTAIPSSPEPQVSPPKSRMTTRGQLGIVKPKKIFTLLTSSVSRIPTTHQKALSDPNWNPAMTEEYDAQIKNRTWSLVSRPDGANIINSMWLYKLKHDADGIPHRHKARLVANGKSQEAGVNYDETFSPVVKPATI